MKLKDMVDSAAEAVRHCCTLRAALPHSPSLQVHDLLLLSYQVHCSTIFPHHQYSLKSIVHKESTRDLVMDGIMIAF
jgi:hypothetical protein